MSQIIQQVNKPKNEVGEASGEKKAIRQRISVILGSISVLAVWSMLIYQLHLTWSLNDQYAHGFLVPFLCLFLVVKARPQNEKSIESEEKTKTRMWLYLGIPCLIILFPLWVIREANSDWRLINVALFFCVSLYTFALISDHGGFSRAKLLAFPILFFAVAIPWPLATDLQLTQWLQGRISSMIVSLLLLLEHEVHLHGNIINVGIFGQVGVDEACSGIHGLQASLVITLFLGSYYRLSIIHRLVFCLAGVVVALALNLTRAFSLAFLKVKGKGELLQEPLFTVFGNHAPSLHDLAGWIESAGILIVLLILARLTRSSSREPTASDEFTSWENLRVSPPAAFGASTCIWLFVIMCLCHMHYQISERSMEELPQIVTNFRDKNIIKEISPISSLVEAQLHYEEAQSIEWQERARALRNPYDGTLVINPNDEYWQSFRCFWQSGGACTSVLSTHSPDACLPLSGLIQIHPPPKQKAEIVTVPLESFKIPFEAYEFAFGSKSLHVFRCFWPHKNPKGAIPEFPSSGYDFSGRIRAAIDGRRNVGGTMLALCVAYVASQTEAVAKLNRQVRQRLSFANGES